MSTTFSDFKVGSISVKDVNEATIAPGLLMIKDGTRTLTVTPYSLSCDGNFTISNATLGTTTGVTVSSSDNSTNLATTAFVKAQSYLTTASLSVYATASSLSDYAKRTIAQTWSALQTFTVGIVTNVINATTTTSAMTFGSNLTTGTLTFGTSTSSTTLNGNTTLSQLASPITPNYSYPVSSGKIGYTLYLTNPSNINATNGNPTVLLTLSVPKGVWLITAHANIMNASPVSYTLMCFNTTTAITTASNCHNQPSGADFSTDISLTSVIQATSDTTYYLVGQLGFNGTFYTITSNMCKIA